MSLGLGASLSKPRLVTPGIVSSSLILKHKYESASVVPISDGAAYFDGTNDYVELSGAFNYNVHSISAWVKPTAIVGGSSIFDYRDANNDGIYLYLADGDVNYQINNTDGHYNSVLTLNQWWHIVATNDGSTSTIYVNGVSVETADTSGETINVSGSAIPRIGARSHTSPDNYFNGYICNVGVWSGVLTQAQIKSIMNKRYTDLTSIETTNLVSWWSLDSTARDSFWFKSWDINIMAATIQKIEKPTRARALDTSGNNNHGQIYSGRALEFDGVADYFQHNGGTALSGVNQFANGESWTFATWINFNTTKFCIFVGNDNSSKPFIGLHNSDWIQFRTASAGKYYRFDSNQNNALAGAEPLQAGTWYRLVITAQSDVLTCYLNGVQHGSTVTTSTNDTTNSVAFEGSAIEFSGWGGPYGSPRAHILDGMMSDGQVWNLAWTADDALFDYLNPEQLALNNSGTSLTNSNLKIWYPMNDGHRGQQSYILDASNTGLGDNLVTNSTFEDNTGWLNSNYSSSSASAIITNTGGQLRVTCGESGDWRTKFIHFPITYTQNVTYKVEFDIRGDVSTSNLTVRNKYGNSSGYTMESSLAVTSNFTSHEYYYVPSGSSDDISFGVSGWHTNASKSAEFFEIDNVYVYPVNDKNHATTVFTGDDLWDGADNSVSNWTAGSGTSTHVAAADCIKLTPATSSNGSYIHLRNSKDLTEDLVVGRKYQLSYDSAGDIVGSESKMSVYDGSSFQAASSTTTVANILSNGDFEAGSGSGTSRVFTSWSQEDGGAGDIEEETSSPHNGSKAVKLTTSSSAIAAISQSATSLTAGTKYLLTYWSKGDGSVGLRHEIYDNSNSANIVASANDNSGNTTTSWVQTAVQFTLPSGCTATRIKFLSPHANGVAYVDDVVVSAFETNTIDFTAGHATNCEFRHQDANGANVVTNGTFASDSGWTKGTGFTIGSGTADCDGSQSGNTVLSQTYAGGFEAGRKYSISFTISDYTAGSINPHITGASSGNVNGNGTKTSVITATSSNNDIVMYANADFDAKIDDIVIYPLENLWVDDISLKEVGIASGWTDADQQLDIPQTALQSYNQLAWFDGYATDTAAELDSTFYFEVGQTINMWVFPNSITIYDSIFGARETENYVRYQKNSGSFVSTNELVQFEPENNTAYSITATSGGTLEIGEWGMYTFIWNADRTIDFYINGEKKGASTATANTTDGKRLKVGHFGAGYGTSSLPFEGAMTEISHYTDILTESEINDLYNDGKAKSALEASGSGGLSLYLRNNGLSEWKDLKGSNDANVDSTETMLITAGADATRDSQGFLMNRQRLTNSLNLDYGENSFVEVPDDTGFSFADDDGDNDSAFSITAWVYMEDCTHFKIANKLQTSNQEWIFHIDSNDKLYLTLYDNSTGKIRGRYDNTTLTSREGEWVHLACTYSGDESDPMAGIDLYIDGTAVDDQDNTNTGTYSGMERKTANLIIGAAQTNSKYSNGKIDDLCIYSKELSATEVTRNYNAGKRSHR